MELEFDLNFWLSDPNRPKIMDLGWALLELSLNDPDYHCVIREIKTPPVHPRQPHRRMVPQPTWWN